MSVKGEMCLGNRVLVGAGAPEFAQNPVTGETMEPAFASASGNEVDQACNLAESAFDTYRCMPLEQRANFLDAIAEELLALGDRLIERAVAESGLPQARIEGERGRTVGQLKLFAELVRSGNFLGARIDPALPDRAPLPRPDLRLRHIPLGPVAVFGASNFPLAFSVAGGDTASALAAGAPVVAKAHPAHPGTSELVAKAIIAAGDKCGMPNGVFSLVFGGSHALGTRLVKHPAIKAVGFTGSRRGGIALMKAAAERPEPIPVYAEMSSINPVFLLPHALREDARAIATGFVGSLTLGAGQFCTNPGLIIGVKGNELSEFIEHAATALSQAPAQTMLSADIHSAYKTGLDELAVADGVALIANGLADTAPNRCQAHLFKTSATQFLSNERLQEELFGAAGLVVECTSTSELMAVAEQLEGQLTATLQLTVEDLALAQTLLPVLERKAGRILCNAYPTGVEVSHAMVHGGPYPATSDGRSTSVGTAAITRFLRPVCYQDLPSALLPPELGNSNELGFARLVDGLLHT